MEEDQGSNGQNSEYAFMINPHPDSGKGFIDADVGVYYVTFWLILSLHVVWLTNLARKIWRTNITHANPENKNSDLFLW